MDTRFHSVGRGEPSYTQSENMEIFVQSELTWAELVDGYSLVIEDMIVIIPSYVDNRTANDAHCRATVDSWRYMACDGVVRTSGVQHASEFQTACTKGVCVTVQ